MNDEQIKTMMLEYIPESVFAGIAEVDTNKGAAYIAQLNRSLCLGAPLVVVVHDGAARYAHKDEALQIVELARNNGLLNPEFYV
jgi:hypothetical protein